MAQKKDYNSTRPSDQKIVKKRKTKGLNKKVPAGGVSTVATTLITRYLGVDPDLAVIIGGFVGALVAYFTPGKELVNA